MKKIMLFLSILLFTTISNARTETFTLCMGGKKSNDIVQAIKYNDKYTEWFDKKHSDIAKIVNDPNEAETYCYLVNFKRKTIITSSNTSLSDFCTDGHWAKSSYPVWESSENTPYELSTPQYIVILDKNNNVDTKNIDSYSINTTIKMFNCEYPYVLPSEAQTVNNFGFFLANKKFHSDAIGVYQKVIAADPNRAVAYFNIADSYAALGQKDLAIQNYKKYVQLMKGKGLDAKIPQRVLDAIK